MHIPFLKYKKIYFIFSGILILASLFFLITFGLKPGIDFSGGSILEFEYEAERPSNQIIKDKLVDFDLGTISLQPTGPKGVILRMKDIDENSHQQILEKLRETGELEERRFESIGPVIGQELKQKTKIIIVLALSLIVLYIAFAFRKVQRPLRSWQFGVAVLIALFHDLLIPLGAFSVLGKFYDVEISIPIVAALLAVLGYSVNDTVVVFDRIRENLLKRFQTAHHRLDDFEEIVNRSLNQTFVRSINTSLTTLLVIFAVFFFGGETLKYFSLALILGISAGTYSSIFIASPILVSWLKGQKSI